MSELYPVMFTLHVKLVECQKDFGDYTTLVFADLDQKGEYYMVTKLPRWECPVLKIGDTGYLKYLEAIAGVTTWYDREKNEHVPYMYTNDYLVNFVLDKPEESSLML